MISVKNSTNTPNVTIFSCRQSVQWLSTSCFYEFEDLISDWMQANVLAPVDSRLSVRRRLSTATYRTFRSRKLAEVFFTPKVAIRHLDQPIDLLFVTLPTPDFSYKLADFSNLRERCDKMVCYIPETWAKRLAELPHHLAPLRQFDHLFVSTKNAVEPMERLSGVRTSFLPFGVDAIKFSPLPFSPTRHIDVMSIGRRSPTTHRALMKAVETRDFYYTYDTVAGSGCRHAADHRSLFANSVKRARYFISNTANFDEIRKTGGAIEIGHRFYEGAAGGAILLGHYPRDHPVILADFDWPDAIVKTELDSADIVDVIDALEADPDRVAEARLNNVRNCLLRHDFVYRWEQVLESVGFEPTAAMVARRSQLRSMADSLSAANTSAAVPVSI